MHQEASVSQKWYHSNSGLQPIAIASLCLVHLKLHICVHLDKCSAALHRHTNLSLPVAPNWQSTAVQQRRGCDLPAHSYSP